MLPITKPEILRTVSDIKKETETLDDIRYIVDEMPNDSSNLDSLVSLKVCRICLAMDVKMYDMSDHQLNIMFERVTGIEINTDNKLPLKLCWECVARLTSANNFVEKVLKTQWTLFNIINSRKFTMTSGIESIKKAKNQLKPTLSKVSKVNDSYLDIIEKSVEIVNEYKNGKNNGFEQIKIKDEHIDIDFEVNEHEGVNNNGIFVVKQENNIEKFDIKVENQDIKMEVFECYLHEQQTQQPSQRIIESIQTRPSNAEQQRRYRERIKADKMNACTTFRDFSDIQPQHDDQINKRQPQSNAERQRKYRKLLRERRKQQQQQMEDINAISPHTISVHQLKNVDQAERARKRYLNKERQRRFRARQRLQSPSTSPDQILQEERSRTINIFR